MATYEFYGYAPEALMRDPETGQFTLDPDYLASEGRVLFDIRDNDAKFDGDRKGNDEGRGKRDEIGEDSDQQATVYDGSGEQVSHGKIYVEEFGYLSGPDGFSARIDIIEIDGVVVGYVTSEPLEPGATYSYAVGANVDDDLDGVDTREDYSYYEQNSVACFGPGTMIATSNGEIPVEWLDTSDKVLTRDDGFQPILWIGRSRVPAGYFDQYPDECPIQIAPGTLGPNSPTHPLNVTGDHRLMIRTPEAELLFASTEVLAPAKAWAETGIAATIKPQSSYMLTHILLASHHVILAQGAWVESLFTGPETMRRLDPENHAALLDLLDPEMQTQQTARPCLKRREAVALLRLSVKPDVTDGSLQEMQRCA